MSARRPQKSPVQDPAFRILVAGAQLSNYMQIEIEPFPMAVVG